MDKLEFLHSAIQDTQQNIRALDFKIGALLAGCIVPFPHIRDIFDFVRANDLMWQQALVSIIFASWLVVVFLLLAALSAIDNPSQHITDSSDSKGTYFSGGLYKFNLLSLCWRPKMYAKKLVQDHKNEIDDPSFDLCKELSYEHLKLIYIRELKLYRLRYATYLLFGLILLGSIAFVSTPNTTKVDLIHQTPELKPKQYLEYLL